MVLLAACSLPAGPQPWYLQDAPPPAQARDIDAIAKEMSNPTAAVASLSSNFDFASYNGTLPGAGSQSSVTYLLQPVFPFPQANGNNVLFRPAIPVPFDRPVFTGAGFEEADLGLGDISFDLAYGGTSKSGTMLLGGLVGTLPTASDDALGGDQWRFGPEIMAGMVRSWGVLGILASHQWDVAGEDSYSTSISGGQYFYAFQLGGGWQFASGPAWSYDHRAGSDDALTFPLGVGIARTVLAGDMPIKVSLQYWHYLESPDSFGLDSQIRLTIAPVFPVPW